MHSSISNTTKDFQMTQLSYLEALPKKLQEKFKNANVTLSDITIDPKTNTIPIEKLQTVQILFQVTPKTNMVIIQSI